MPTNSDKNYLEAFLYEHYLVAETYSEVLKKYGWYDKLEKRFRYLVETESPDYSTAISTMVQSVNDKLREFNDENQKALLEGLMSILFRDSIAFFLKTKIDFHADLPNIRDKLEEMYLLNGDDFTALDDLTGISAFVEKTIKARSHSGKTLRFNWNSTLTSATVRDLEKLLIEEEIIAPESSLKAIFEIDHPSFIFVYKKKRKFLTLIFHALIIGKQILPEGSKETYGFIERKIKLQDTKEFLKCGYMKRTVYNTKKIGIGDDKYRALIERFFRKLK